MTSESTSSITATALATWLFIIAMSVPGGSSGRDLLVLLPLLFLLLQSLRRPDEGYSQCAAENLAVGATTAACPLHDAVASEHSTEPWLRRLLCPCFVRTHCTHDDSPSPTEAVRSQPLPRSRPASAQTVHSFSENQLRSTRPSPKEGADGPCPPPLLELQVERVRAFEAKLADDAGWASARLVCERGSSDATVRVRARSRADSRQHEFRTEASIGGVRAEQALRLWAQWEHRVRWDSQFQLSPAYLKPCEADPLSLGAAADASTTVDIVCYLSPPAGPGGIIASRAFVDLRSVTRRSTADGHEVMSATGPAPAHEEHGGLDELGEWCALADRGKMVHGHNLVGCGFRFAERKVHGRPVTDLVLLTCTELAGSIGRLPPSLVNGAVAGVLCDMVDQLAAQLKERCGADGLVAPASSLV